MAVPLRLALFTAVLAAAFGAAALVGAAVDPSGAEEDAPSHAAEPEGGHAAAPASGDAALPGLSAAQDGLRLEVDDVRRAAGRRSPVRFRVLGDDGRPVRRFDLAHEKRMHLIVVRRDLTGFQHLHPEMAADGTWEATADLGDAGTYRLYADFTIGGEQHTLGADVQVGGDFVPVALPAMLPVASAGDGIEVRLHRRGGELDFSVTRDGRPVDDRLQPYLGAKGHLVALRVADLAYLHTHPHGDELAFETELPTAGAYRVWVQFRLDGAVRTAAFTIQVAS